MCQEGNELKFANVKELSLRTAHIADERAMIEPLTVNAEIDFTDTYLSWPEFSTGNHLTHRMRSCRKRHIHFGLDYLVNHESYLAITVNYLTNTL